MARMIARLGALLAALSIAACATKSLPSEEFLLEPKVPEARPDRSGATTMAIRAVRSLPHLGRDVFVRKPGHRVIKDPYMRWAVSVEDMVAEALYKRLGASGLFREVFGAGSNAEADLELRVEVAALEEREVESQGAAGPTLARVELRFDVARQGALVQRLDARHDVPVASRENEVLAVALALALEQCLDDLIAALESRAGG